MQRKGWSYKTENVGFNNMKSDDTYDHHLPLEG
jgi:hypothetical protein